MSDLRETIINAALLHWCNRTQPIFFDDALQKDKLVCKIVAYVNNLLDATRNLVNSTEHSELELLTMIEKAYDDIAPEFKTTTAYAAGDYVMYEGTLYTFTQAHAAGAWNTSHVETVTLAGEIADRLKKPTVAGTSGQVLVSDGEGGQVWGSIAAGQIVVDNTLTVAGAAADAKKTGDEISGLKTDLLQKADASGTSENLTAGNAEQLLTDKGITDKVPYLLRASGGNGADREEDKIVGGTVAWNQIAYLDQNEHALSALGVTYTSISENSFRLHGTISAVNDTYLDSHAGFIPNVVGHKYLVWVNCNNSSASNYFKFHQGSKYYANILNSPLIYQQGSESRPNCIETLQTGSVDYTFSWNKIDLTVMLGTAIADRAYAMEQATAGSGIAWLKSMGFFTADYYPYDAGTLKSVEGLTAHRMVGFNQWDEKVANGYFNEGGQWNVSDNVVASNNAIPVIPGATYYFRNGSNTSLYITFWKEAVSSGTGHIGQCLGRSSDISNQVYTIPNDCRYIHFNCGTVYGGTYKNDICINLSDPAKNGTYEPYVKHSYPLDSTLTLRGILKLDSNNQVYYDGDEYSSDGTVTRRYGIVDLGTLNWVRGNRNNDNTANIFYITTNQYASGEGVCAKFVYAHGVQTWENLKKDEFIITGTNEKYVVFAADYETANAFKTAMSGVYLVYPLATASTEEADPYQNPQILDPYGTEEYETTGIVPVGHDTFYPENLRSKIEGLPFNFATLIAPTETAYKATRAYTTGNLFIVNNILYKATTGISNGGTITPGTNCTATTLAEIIAALS